MTWNGGRARGVRRTIPPAYSAVEVREPLLVGVVATPLGGGSGAGCPVQGALEASCLALSVLQLLPGLVEFFGQAFDSCRHVGDVVLVRIQLGFSLGPFGLCLGVLGFGLLGMSEELRAAAFRLLVDGRFLWPSCALGWRFRAPAAHGPGLHRRELGRCAALVQDTESDVAQRTGQLTAAQRLRRTAASSVSVRWSATVSLMERL